jgi:hypothetical protein
MIASIAGNTRWAYEQDRQAATAPAREGLEARFEREVDPDGELSAPERAKRVANLKRAYYMRLARLSAEARRRRG